MHPVVWWLAAGAGAALASLALLFYARRRAHEQTAFLWSSFYSLEHLMTTTAADVQAALAENAAATTRLAGLVARVLDALASLRNGGGATSAELDNLISQIKEDTAKEDAAAAQLASGVGETAAPAPGPVLGEGSLSGQAGEATDSAGAGG